MRGWWTWGWKRGATALLVGLLPLFAFGAERSSGSATRRCFEPARDTARPERVFGQTVAVDKNGLVYFKGRGFPDLAAQPYPVGKTTRFVSRRHLNTHGAWDPVGTGARGIALLLHGNGADYSHSGAMFPVLRVMAAVPGDAGFAPEVEAVTTQLFSHPTWLPLAPVAIDLPGHGLGPAGKDFLTLPLAMAWLDAIVDDLLSFGLPVYLVARSGSGGLAGSYTTLHPGKIRAQGMISPVHSGVDLEGSLDRYFQLVHQKAFIPNFEGYFWIEGLTRTMTWHDARPLFGNTPTAILLGGRDPENSDAVRDAFASLHGVNRTRVEIVRRAAHDALALAAVARAVSGYQKIYDVYGVSDAR